MCGDKWGDHYTTLGCAWWMCPTLRITGPATRHEQTNRYHDARRALLGPLWMRLLESAYDMTTHLDLFSGIGGFALAARWNGIDTVAFCEVDEFCRNVLRKHWPNTPIHGDVRELDGTEYRGVDIITGGYPCQPFSLAGERRGAEDDRHLWPEMRRIIEQARPAVVIAENVLGHVSMGLDEVLHDMEGIGYAARAVVVPACAADAPHQRDRLWILAHATSARPHASPQARVHRGQEGARTRNGKPERLPRWSPEPGVARVVDGIPSRMDRSRIKSLGNAIVPQVAAELMLAALSN